MSDTNVYQQVQLQVSNAQEGQSIVVELAVQGSPVAWSTGPAFASSSGINIQANTGAALPLTNFSISASMVRVYTSASGGGSSWSFSIALYLVAQAGIQAFSLRSSSDPGVVVQASIGNTRSQTLNSSFSAFAWP